MLEIEKSFSIDPLLFRIVTHELKLATYNDLQSVYDLTDMYDLLEIIDANDTMAAVARKQAEQANKK